MSFAVAGLATVCLIGIGGLWAGRRAGEMQAISEVRGLAESVANTAVAPNLTDELLAGDPAAIAEFDRLVKQRVVSGSTVRVKLWTEDGTIIYSDDPRLIGARYELSSDKVETFEQNLASAEISDLAGPENLYEPAGGQLLEVYQPVLAQDGSTVLYESYTRLTRSLPRAAKSGSPSSP